MDGANAVVPCTWSLGECPRPIIAAKCDISYATVNTHVGRIYEKLQVKGVASAVNLAVREGLI